MNRETLPAGSGLSGEDAGRARAVIRRAIGPLDDRIGFDTEGSAPAPSFVARGILDTGGSSPVRTQGRTRITKRVAKPLPFGMGISETPCGCAESSGRSTGSRSCGTGAHIVAFPWSAFAKQCPYQTPVVCIGMEGTLRGKHSRNEKETADLPRTEGNKGPGLFLFCRCFRRKETARNGVIPNIGEMEGEHPLLIRTGCNSPGGSAAGRRQEKQLEIHCQHCHRCGKITIGLSGKE